MSDHKRVVILFYQHITREIKTLEKLKREIERISDLEAVLFSIDFEWHQAVRLAKKRSVVVVVSPWAYSEDNYKLFTPFIRANKETAIVNLHSEQISSPYSEAILLPSANCVKTGVVHFVWGSYFAEKLIRCGVPKDLIVETGNIRNDEIGDVESDRQNLACQYGLDRKKKWVLYAENRDWVYQWSTAYANEYVSRGGDSQQAEHRYELSKQSLELSISEMNNLPSSFFDEYELIYRPHPGSASPNRPRNPVRTITDRSIYEWLHSSDFVVVWSSTTLFEADAMGVPAIVHEVIDNDPLFRTDGADEYIKIRSLNEINDKLLEEAYQLHIDKGIYRRYCGPMDGSSVIRIANSIVCLSEVVPEAYTLHFVNATLACTKKAVYEWLTRIFSKTGLLAKFKFPRSAFDHRRDIPWKTKGFADYE